MRLAIFAAGVVIADAIRPIESDWKMALLVLFLFALFSVLDGWDFMDRED